LQLVGNPDLTWENRAQFYAYAARRMREILVDEARRCSAAKRGGGTRPVHLERAADLPAPGRMDPDDLLDLEEALGRLAQSQPDLEQVVVLYYYGWELKQIADMLHTPYSTVKKRLARALSELHRALCGKRQDA
jgi:RNA polymerase sigma factor (TIGR02999 family)